MFATAVELAAAVILVALLIAQRDRARARRQLPLRLLEAAARDEAAAQRAAASQFSRT